MDIIVDIDGTVAEIQHRLHFVKDVPKRWEEFYGNIENDVPIMPVVRLIQSLWSDRANSIIFCTGRTDNYKPQTVAWLTKHVFRPTNLYMRSAGDYRDDSVVKLELLAQMRADGFQPILAIEDRKRVVDMWRANGIFCMQVADGEF